MSTLESLIPRHVLFSDPEKLNPKLSPNGQWVSYLAPYRGELNLWLAPFDDLRAATAVTQQFQPIKDHCWSGDSTYLLYVHDEKGDENWQLHGYDSVNARHQAYTPKGYHAKIIHISAKKPDKIMIALNQRDKRYHDVYLLDLASATLTCIYENNQYWEFIADEELTLRFGLQINAQGGEYIDLQSKQKKCVVNITQHDLFGLYFYPRLRLGLSADGNQLFFVESVHTNTSQLSMFDCQRQQQIVLGGQVEADICDVLLHPVNKKPLAYAINQDRKHWFSVDASITESLQFLKSYADADIDIIGQSVDNQLWLVAFVHDNGPVGYYAYQRDTQNMRYLFDSHPQFKPYTFTRMQPHKIKVRDGLECVSYLSLPHGHNEQPVPLVLMVHGGPNFRDFWGFNPIHQWLTNRGYAVLSVNYRASTGFGKAHAMAGNGEWGRKIQEDLLDAVAWAIQTGVTTSEQVAIMGRSFGGYATLMALTQTPDVFCCGIDIVGPANLETMAANFPAYWKSMQTIIYSMMLGCDPNTEEGKAFLAARSPIHFVDHIKKPLLIGHGANDVRVKQEESDHMAAAMQQNQIPVTYVYFPDEGHQFMHPGNRMAFYALVEAFLGKILKGRVEPRDKQQSTSMIVKVDNYELTN